MINRTKLVYAKNKKRTISTYKANHSYLKKIKFGILIIAMFFFLFIFFAVLGALFHGFVENTEYEALPNGYYVCESSAHDISICNRESIIIIPAKVVELDYDNRYVIIKQVGLKKKFPNNPNNSYEIPDYSKVYFWIIDTKDAINYGPYIEKQDYEELVETLNIKNLNLQKIESFTK